MNAKTLCFLVGMALLCAACNPQPSRRGTFARGADVSWLSEMEHDSVPFFFPDGRQGDCLDVLKAQGANAVRLRVWVNHNTGWSNPGDVVPMARKAAEKGLRIMIDFHYSDFFADPSHQTIPEAWNGLDYDGLCDAVGKHTKEVLGELKKAGVEPEWVQVGNETPNGMLWPVGRVIDLNAPRDTTHAPLADNWKEYAGLTAAGYEAAKAVFPNVNVIVHVDNAFQLRDWFFRAMEEHGGKYDMIGLSHYPMMSEWSGITWQEANRRAGENIRALIKEFHRPVMVAEIGMANWGDGPVYDSVAAMADSVMNDFLTRIAHIDSCAGVFYWEPQCYGGWRPAEYIPLGWNGYNMGSFTPQGRPAPALKSLMGMKK